MLPVPVTYYFDFKRTNDLMRPYVMHEFASYGVRHLVLGECLLQLILGDRTMVKTLSQEMAAEGLSFLDSHAVFGPYLDLCCPEPDARAEMLLRLKLQLHIIAALGVKTVTIHTGNETHYPSWPLEVLFDFIKRSLDELLPLAEKLGLVICLENIWFQINTADRLLAIKREYPSDALGFCYDSGHANLMDKGRNFPGSKPFTAWSPALPRFDDRFWKKCSPMW